MKAFIFLSVVAVAFATQCGKNEHFESCGTSCPLTCNNRYNPPNICNLRCNSGCQCDDGFIRNEADGRCVKIMECPPPKCGPHEVFYTCGTACPPTCNNYFKPRRPCILRCDIGCFCKEGYVRNVENRRCVKPKECPTPKCGENERFDTCGSACPLTCDNYKDGPIPCILKCDIGCHCEQGYVKNSEGKCVRPEDCPANSKRIKKQESGSSSCFLPAETGFCRGFFPRYFYDGVSGRCEKFIYGGCGGNENNFKTEEECMKRCAAYAPEACLQDKVTGLCDAYFPRYYFNKESGQCERFVYGGCGGNSNNFETKEDCEAVCQ